MPHFLKFLLLSIAVCLSGFSWQTTHAQERYTVPNGGLETATAFQSGYSLAVEPPLVMDTGCGENCDPDATLRSLFQTKVKGLEAKISGFINLDLIQDLDAIGDTDRFDTRTIFTDGRDGSNFRAHARTTRLGLELKWPTELGSLKARLEGDFFGAGNTIRLRHGYAELGPILVGQTWSTFTDHAILPRTLDFENPTGALNLRRAQARWTHHLTDDWTLAFAIEDPASTSTISPSPGVNGRTEAPSPDFVVHTRWNHDYGHLQAAGFWGRARFESVAGATDTESVYGFSYSGVFNLGESDRLKFQISTGEGLPRFRGVTSVVANQAGNLEASSALAWIVGYEHHWSEKYASTFAYSARRRDLVSGESLQGIRGNEYASANLIWTPVERVHFGVEYLYGTRQNFDGSNGDAHRMMFSARFELP